MRTSSLVDQLPRYASDNPEAMPSIRFHEGDLRDIIKILYTSLTIRSTNMEHRSPCYRVTCSQLKVDCCPYNRLIVIITSASARRISNKLGGAVKTMCNPPPFSKAKFPSLTACLYLLDSRDPEWCLRQASKHNFSLLWPWPLTLPPRSTVHAIAPGKDLGQFSLKSVHSFSFTSW